MKNSLQVRPRPALPPRRQEAESLPDQAALPRLLDRGGGDGGEQRGGGGSGGEGGRAKRRL